MKKIVAAVDFSNATPAVLDAACAQAKAFGAELHLFHVVEPQPSYTAYGFTPDEFPAMQVFQEEAKQRATRQLEELLAKVSSEIPTAVIRLSEGSPLRTLIDYVEKTGADLVVLGSHGHGAIASLLLGSVAEGMVRKSKIATLVIPAPEE